MLRILVLLCVVLSVSQVEVSGQKGTSSNFVMRLERTACFGTCPTYTVTILNDGTVTYEGKEFVKQKGKFTTKISQATVKMLRQEFNKINFFALRNTYLTTEDGCSSDVTDFPSAIISVESKSKSKTVRHYQGCRGLEILKKLKALEAKIDEIAQTRRWIG